MKRILILLAFLFVFASCKVAKKTSTTHVAITQKTDSTTSRRHDSAWYEKIETIHDTQFIVKPDSASIRALIRCNERGEAFLQQIIQLKNGRRISQTLKLKNNILTASAHIDSAAIYFAYKETHIKEGKTLSATKTTQKTDKSQVKDETTTKKTVTKWPVSVYLLIITVLAFLFYRYVLPVVSPWLKILLKRF